MNTGSKDIFPKESGGQDHSPPTIAGFIDRLGKTVAGDRFLLTALALAIVLLFVIALIREAPVHSGEEGGAVSPEPTDQETRVEVNDSLYTLLAEQVFLQGRLRTAAGDSVSVSIDLADSMLILELKGVTIHECRLTSFRMSPLLKRAGKRFLLEYTMNPFRLEYSKSTLPRQPIMLKKAPRDTVEAMQTQSIPQLAADPYIHYIMFFDRFLVLEVRELLPDTLTRKQGRSLSIFKTGCFAGQTLYSLLPPFQPPQQRIWITLRLPAADAKVLFRAIPVQARMNLRLPSH
ncbi:MAG: hypothetical protein JW861_08800 [Bacteroidales bacterium]|nr:hypothetical protein [Bacteroidales bacterium]